MPDDHALLQDLNDWEQRTNGPCRTLIYPCEIVGACSAWLRMHCHSHTQTETLECMSVMQCLSCWTLRLSSGACHLACGLALKRCCLVVQVQRPDCPNVYSAAYMEAQVKGSNLTLCTEQQKNMNGSAIALYNDTTYYDDLIFAATWLYKASGDNAYLQDAEAFYVKHLYDAVSPSSRRPVKKQCQRICFAVPARTEAKLKVEYIGLSCLVTFSACCTPTVCTVPTLYPYGTAFRATPGKLLLLCG